MDFFANSATPRTAPTPLVDGDRHATRYLTRRAGPALLAAAPDPGLGLVVAIPAFDEPDLSATLDSLAACHRTTCAVEVLVLVNAPATADRALRARSERCLAAVNAWQAGREATTLQVRALAALDLPPKHAGVGLARKLVMDEALRRLCAAGRADGVIACLDADCTVAPNYLTAIVQLFAAQPRLGACTVHFEHPLDDPQLGPLIARYELYLRYYRLGLAYAGSPHAHYTVGSCMAVRAAAYARQGGMNRRQAGEDFYFMQKLVDGEQVAALGSTCVMPAARRSHRVPFGTGRALNDALVHPARIAFEAPQVFDDLRALFAAAEALYAAPLSATVLAQLSPPLQAFLATREAPAHIAEIRANVADAAAFRRRLARWFNGFACMKYARFVCPRHYAHAAPETALAGLAARLGLPTPAAEASVRSWLALVRRLEQAGFIEAQAARGPD